MIVDPLTKGLSPKTFTSHVENMGIISTSVRWMLLLMVIWHFELVDIMFLKYMFSTLCMCMKIMMWKTNYIIVDENDIVWTHHGLLIVK